MGLPPPSRSAALLLVLLASSGCLIAHRGGSLGLDLGPRGFALFSQSPFWHDLQKPYRGELAPQSGVWRHSVGLRVERSSNLSFKLDHPGPDGALVVHVYDEGSKKRAGTPDGSAASRELSVGRAEPGEYLVVVSRKREQQEPREFSLLASLTDEPR